MKDRGWFPESRSGSKIEIEVGIRIPIKIQGLAKGQDQGWDSRLKSGFKYTGQDQDWGTKFQDYD